MQIVSPRKKWCRLVASDIKNLWVNECGSYTQSTAEAPLRRWYHVFTYHKGEQRLCGAVAQLSISSLLMTKGLPTMCQPPASQDSAGSRHEEAKRMMTELQTASQSVTEEGTLSGKTIKPSHLGKVIMHRA